MIGEEDEVFVPKGYLGYSDIYTFDMEGYISKEDYAIFVDYITSKTSIYVKLLLGCLIAFIVIMLGVFIFLMFGVFAPAFLTLIPNLPPSGVANATRTDAGELVEQVVTYGVITEASVSAIFTLLCVAAIPVITLLIVVINLRLRYIVDVALLEFEPEFRRMGCCIVRKKEVVQRPGVVNNAHAIVPRLVFRPIGINQISPPSYVTEGYSPAVYVAPSYT